MRVKSFILLTIMFLAVGITQAQDLPEFEGEIKWSELFEVNRKVGEPSIIGNDGKYVYILRWVKKDHVIEKYDMRTLKLKAAAEVDLTYNKKPLLLQGQFMFGTKPMLYTSFYNKKTNINYSFVHKVNKSSLQISEPIPVGKVTVPKGKGIQGKLAMSMTTSLGGYASRMIISPDNELGFLSQIEYADQEKKGETPKVKALIGKLYDNNLELLAESEYQLPYERFTIFQTKLGDNGLVYMAGYQTSTETDNSGLIKKQYTEYGELEILVLEPETGDIETLEVGIGGEEEVKGFTFKIDEADNIIISGMFGPENGGITGAFYARYNSLLKEQGMNFVEFEEDFITQGWSDKKKEKFDKKQRKNERKGEKKDKPVFYEYIVRDLITKPDGTSTLLAEQYYMRVVTTTYTDSRGNLQTRTTYYYYYKDIIAVNFKADGELDWKTVVDKYQMSTNDGGYYSSFFTVLEGNDINIIYNDRESKTVDTEGMTKQQKRNLARKTVGVRVLINDEGGLSREKLFEFEESGLRLVPKVCGTTEEDLAFLYARSRKGDKIGLIEW